MTFILINLTFVLLLVPVGIFFNKICRMFLSDKQMTSYRKHIRYTQITLFAIIGLCIVTGVMHWNQTDYFKKSDNIVLEENQVNVTGDYKLVIPFTDIVDVSLIPMPGLSYRTNGMSFMGIKKGYFKLTDGSKCYLNINYSNPEQVIKINRIDNIPVFLSGKTQEGTLTFYKEIKERSTTDKEL